MVRELLLGDNPFIGVSHLAHEKARETMRELTVEKKIEVIEAALECGATGFTFSTHSSNLEMLKYLKDREPSILKKMNYYILVPYALKYVREATKNGVPGLVKKILTSNMKMGTAALTALFSPAGVVKSFIDAELRDYVRVLPTGNVKAVLLHEVLTELILAFNLVDLVRDVQAHFQKRGVGFGLETRNIKHLKEFLRRNNLQLNYVMTPMNLLGYQMTPTLEEALSSVAELASMNVKIIAMNILASGVIELRDAVEFLSRYSNHLYAIAVGTSKPQRAREIFSSLSRFIS